MGFFFFSFLIPFSIFLPNAVIYLTVSQEVKTKTVNWAYSPVSDHNQTWLNQGMCRSYFEPLFLWLPSCFWKVFGSEGLTWLQHIQHRDVCKENKAEQNPQLDTLHSPAPGQHVHPNIWRITVDFCFESSGPYFELPRILMFLLLNVFAVFPLYIFAWDGCCAHSTAACTCEGFAEGVQWGKVLLYIWSQIIK